VTRSAKQLSIKLSTAKLIVKTFKETGKLLNKRMRSKARDANGLKCQKNVENEVEHKNV